MPTSDYVKTDELTVLLGLIAASVFLLRNLYRPQPLVHPILLGRQSDVSRVRNPGESAVYRNYGTGMIGRFPLRPAKEVQVLADLVKSDVDTPRTLWSTKITNPRLKERVSAVATGLVRSAGLVPGESNVLLLLNDGIEFLITDLALASLAVPSFTISSLSLLASVLDSHPPSAIITDAHFLPHLIELVYDGRAQGEQHTIVVLGEPDEKSARMNGIKVVSWADVEGQGAQGEKVVPVAVESSTVFTVSFYEKSPGQIESAHFTHENMTAGVASVRVLLPLANAMSSLDTIVSAHSMNTAFGRAIAYTAVYEGTSFATLASTRLTPHQPGQGVSSEDLKDLLTYNNYPIPSPTILFVRPTHVRALTDGILYAAKSSSMAFGVAYRHKLSALAEGSVTKESLWDRLVFDGARMKVIGEGAGTVRAVISAGEPLEASALTPIRLALSVPFVNAHVHPSVAGPVCATHPLDLQSFAESFSTSSSTAAMSDAPLAPVGPPAINVEAKLSGVHDAEVEKGVDPSGTLLVRGPVVGRRFAVGEEGNVLAPKSPVKAAFSTSTGAGSEQEQEWLNTGEKARVLTNGAFKVWRA